MTSRFPPRVPPLLEHLDELSLRDAGRPVVVCLDYDGTLTPIVNDPTAAHLSADMRSTLEHLAQRHSVAIISGRDRSDVEARVGLAGVIYAGSHGFDIGGSSSAMTLPEAEAARPALARAGDELARRLGSIAGVVLERKRFGVATHYRNVAPSHVDDVKQIVYDVLAPATGLRVQPGKMVLDVQPDVAWNKGRAVDWILNALSLDSGRAFVIYLGDDETDEDAFQSLGTNGLGVRVGPEGEPTQADYRLEDPDGVRRFLQWLAR